MLTDLAIRSLPVPEKGVKRYWDKDGLCLQVSQGGTKTFYYVHGEKRRFTKLGRYPTPLTLSDARERVRTIIAKKTLGVTDETAAPGGFEQPAGYQLRRSGSAARKDTPVGRLVAEPRAVNQRRATIQPFRHPFLRRRACLAGRFSQPNAPLSSSTKSASEDIERIAACRFLLSP